MTKLFLSIILCCTALSINAQCDATKRPIVFIHGFLASGDTYAEQILRFKQRIYCANRLFVFDWNSVGGNGKKTDSLLSAFIDNVLAITKATQIDLVGHSAGGGLGRGYLIDSVNALKVAHYVHLGSRKWFYEFSWFPNKKCLNIYSSADMVMGKMGGDVEGANNLDLKDKDHYEAATSAETFHAMYSFFNDGKVESDTYAIFEKSLISGKAVLLGDNTPMVKARVLVHKLNSSRGQRLSKNPFAVFQTDNKGSWGNFIADRKSSYELELIPFDSSQRTISYFFEPFKNPNSYLYLRGFPKGNLIASMLGNLPVKNDQSLIIVFSSQKAVIAGRDSLAINNVPLSSATLTPASKTIISTFLFDDGDGKTSGKPLKQFGTAPFLGGVDVSLPVSKKGIHTVYYNGRKLTLPAKSSKERIMLAVFN
jgi:hypothetical protein